MVKADAGVMPKVPSRSYPGRRYGNWDDAIDAPDRSPSTDGPGVRRLPTPASFTLSSFSFSSSPSCPCARSRDDVRCRCCCRYRCRRRLCCRRSLHRYFYCHQGRRLRLQFRCHPLCGYAAFQTPQFALPPCSHAITHAPSWRPFARPPSVPPRRPPVLPFSSPLRLPFSLYIPTTLTSPMTSSEANLLQAVRTWPRPQMQT